MREHVLYYHWLRVFLHPPGETIVSAIEGISPLIQHMRTAYGDITGFRRAGMHRADPQMLDDTTSLEQPKPQFNRDIEKEAADSADSVEQMDKVVDEANSAMQINRRSLRFRIDRDADVLQVQVVDSVKDRVIRSIPSDEMLALSVRLRELFGLGSMVDTSR